MTQEKIIAIWDILHQKNTGDLGFSDLEKAIDEVEYGILSSKESARSKEDLIIREEHGEIK